MRSRKANQRAKEIRKWLFQRLSNGKKACVLCGYDKDERALEIDHVHGGGYAARRGKNRLAYWKAVRLQYLRAVVAAYQSGNKDQNIFRLLCRICNWLTHLDRTNKKN